MIWGYFMQYALTQKNPPHKMGDMGATPQNTSFAELINLFLFIRNIFS